MESFHTTFCKIRDEYDRGNPRGLVCKAGFYGNCPVLKLQKPHWTNDRMDELRNQTGIFFSIWLGEASARKNRALYNIHALKLRQLKSYSITSIDFAKNFRRRFETVATSWPNVRTDYGPLTLMQGWIEINTDSFERQVTRLMRQFVPISRLIDDLLLSRQRNAAGKVPQE